MKDLSKIQVNINSTLGLGANENNCKMKVGFNPNYKIRFGLYSIVEWAKAPLRMRARLDSDHGINA